MQRNYKLLISSFFLLNIYSWLCSPAESLYGIPVIVKYLIAVFVIATIIYYKISKPSKPASGGLFNTVIVFFIVWSIILTLFTVMKFKGIFDLQRALAVPFFFLPYVLPIFILYTKFDLEFFKQLFNCASILIIPALLMQLVIILTGLSLENYGEKVARIEIFDLGSGFLLLTSHISNRKRISNFILVYTLLMIVLFAVFGRRGVLMQYFFLLFFMIVIRLRSSFLNREERMKIYFAGLFLTLFIVAFGHFVQSSYAFQRGFTKDALEESRGVVFEAFFSDFNSTTDLIFGRGLGGTVLRSLMDKDARYMDTIENGFLTILLKGGLLYLIPFVLILLRAFYLGCFRSNNDLSKALAFLILLYVIGMFYFNLPNFSTSYFFIWISIVACFTPEIRNMNDEEISNAINA